MQAVEEKLRQIITQDTENPVVDLRMQSSQQFTQGPQHNRNTIRSGKASVPDMGYGAVESPPQQQYYNQGAPQQPNQYFNPGATPPPPPKVQQPQPYQPPNPYSQFAFQGQSDNDQYKS
jgi:hypothetical protein